MPSPDSTSDPPPAVLDIDAQQVGTVYAKALLGATEKAGTTEATIAEFDSLIADVLNRQPKFETVLASGAMAAEDVIAVLDKVFAKQASPLFLNFLKVLAQHGRLNCLRAVHVAAKHQHNEMRGRVVVRVTTASDVGVAMNTLVGKALRGVLGAEPVLEKHVDPSLIAGVVVQVGDTVYDGSVRTQFQRLRSQMIDRSVHEIQSSRERFSSEE